MKEKLTLNPWLKMWIAPRQTVKAIVQYNPKHRFYVLCAIYGFAALLHFAQNISLGEVFSWGWILLESAILATVAGFVCISLWSAILYWIGKWIGGTAPYAHIRAAIAWTNVTAIVSGLAWLGLAANFGTCLFFSDFPEMNFLGLDLAVVSTLFFVQSVMAVWSFVLTIKSLSEVQGFSSWKALLNIVLPFLLLMGVMWMISWIVNLT